MPTEDLWMQQPATRPPQTYHYSPAKMMATLDYLEMVALSTMFERWALTEESVTGDHRTQLIQWSSDLERIAVFCGPGWKASDPGEDVSLLAFLARRELRSRHWRQSPHPIGFELDRLRFA